MARSRNYKNKSKKHSKSKKHGKSKTYKGGSLNDLPISKFYPLNGGIMEPGISTRIQHGGRKRKMKGGNFTSLLGTNNISSAYSFGLVGGGQLSTPSIAPTNNSFTPLV